MDQATDLALRRIELASLRAELGASEAARAHADALLLGGQLPIFVAGIVLLLAGIPVPALGGVVVLTEVALVLKVWRAVRRTRNLTDRVESLAAELAQLERRSASP